MPEQQDKLIDIKRVIQNKNKRLARFLPQFVINYIRRIIHEDEINAMINKNKHLTGLSFLENVTNEFDIQFELKGVENFPPASERCIFAANHPIGSIDGLLFMREAGKQYGITKSVVNDLLLHIDNLKPLFAGVNKHGANSRGSVEEFDTLFDSQYQILMFPAGLVSRRKKGKIRDTEWKKTVISRAVKHKRTIVPVYIEGQLSNFFYNLAQIRTFFQIKANLEMFFLVDEMFRQKGKKISFTIGKPIRYEVFNKSKTDKEWVEKLKTHIYNIADNPNAHFE
jgi:putative hemolysin